MNTYKIAVIPGDGTGPEVTAEAVKVLNAAEDKFGFKFEKTEYDLGGTRYLKTGETLSDETLEELRGYDSILLGAIGHPDIKPGILEKGVLLKARFGLDQYINLRPVKLFPGVETPIKGKGPKEIDYVVVRENTGGVYTGVGGNSQMGTANEVAVQSNVYTRFQVERCLRFAFDYARKYGKKARGAGEDNTLTLVGKTNVLTYVWGLWERAFNEIGDAEYPDIKRAYCHVDAACIYMIQCPEMFDIVVTGNMFGDIITDLGAITQGGLGIAAGGNINPEGVSMFEPIGGTAPSFTGLNQINPLAAILSGAMMIQTLGETEAAEAIENAVRWATANKLKSMAAAQMGYSTTEVGDMVAERIKN
ncbi:3-isopropylmalate dehydrogenase [Limihaloglobus sulfuriphilus]|uniref:3-isopropylmalate dehydrogenase n=1 Tax=Limihaloglobus sulfuriphilus TaxID=1851148 RepID=A0A1Q2MD73_9BACT|nr:3-isopropylmalate dehydrogenase [Limihaloglobus sulfuriphilus]AQQ70641.1 3-isopropylmalate dehydrogenase [Limihaloglobus sulfuriphilus]